MGVLGPADSVLLAPGHRAAQIHDAQWSWKLEVDQEGRPSFGRPQHGRPAHPILWEERARGGPDAAGGLAGLAGAE